MKKILILHDFSKRNIGDLLTLEGTLNILTEAYGKVKISKLDIGTCEKNASIIRSLSANFDYFVLAGTPWIWDKCTYSKKFKVLKSTLKKYGNIKKIGLGIGSCFPLYYDNNYEFIKFLFSSKKEFKESINSIFKQFDLLFVRDNLAQYALNATSVFPYFAYCTSVFGKDFRNESRSTKRPVLIFYDPCSGISKGTCDKPFLENYYSLQKEIARKYNASVLCITKGDAICALKKGIIPKIVTSLKKMSEYLDKASWVVSGRVHMAVLAWKKNIPTYIMPVDSRYFTVLPLGIKPIFGDSPDRMDFLDDKPSVYYNLKNRILENKKFIIKKLRDLDEDK